jgi:hypothetical protein
MRRRALLIVSVIILTILALCVLSAAIGIAWYVLSGALTIPYHDAPPTPGTQP